MSRVLVLFLALVLSGTPVGALLCELTCGPEAVASMAAACHDADAATQRLSEGGHGCDHERGSAEAMPEATRDARAPLAAAILAGGIDALLPALDRLRSQSDGASGSRSHASPPPLQLRI